LRPPHQPVIPNDSEGLGSAGPEPLSECSYNIARMRFEILLAPEAVQDLQSLKANARVEVRDAIERHLRHEPRKERRSRIKRLRGTKRPQYRLRVEDVRVFYDVQDARVEVLAIVSKEGAEKWLENAAERK
jgi:mRNA interferase RelE/StbE